MAVAEHFASLWAISRAVGTKPPESAANPTGSQWHVGCTSERYWSHHVSHDHPAPCPDADRPRRRRLTLALVLGAALAASAASSPAQENSEPIRAFINATQQYASMHRRLEQQIGPIELNTTPEAINRFIQAMAAAIRAERPGAQQGDLFAPAVAPELRARINEALLEHGFTAADVRAAELAHGVDPGTVKLRVNGTFPWVLSVAMLPCVLDALPPLPPELQYRIVGNDLLLIDLHASLIVDILPSALADLTARARRMKGVAP